MHQLAFVLFVSFHTENNHRKSLLHFFEQNSISKVLININNRYTNMTKKNEIRM